VLQQPALECVSGEAEQLGPLDQVAAGLEGQLAQSALRSSEVERVEDDRGMCGNSRGLAQARQLAEQPLNPGFWHSMLGNVAVAHIVGLADDPRVVELLALTRRVLAAAFATDAAITTLTASLGPFYVSQGLRTLALAEWIATSEPQILWFERALTAQARHFAVSTARKKPSLQYNVRIASDDLLVERIVVRDRRQRQRGRAGRREGQGEQ
jgi:hypothetical protein